MTEGHTEGDARSIPLISAKEKQSSERQCHLDNDIGEARRNKEMSTSETVCSFL